MRGAAKLTLFLLVVVAAGVGAQAWADSGNLRPHAPFELRIQAIPLIPATIRPTVDVGAFSHDARLAFVSQGSLWVLDGRAGTLRQVAVPVGDTPSNPSFSSDGRWLSYIARPSSPTASVELCVAKGDRTDAEVVAPLVGIPNQEAIRKVVGWSPTGDRLAFDVSRSLAPPPTRRFSNIFANDRNVVVVWQPGEPVKVIATVEDFTGGAWSPDGRELAIGSATWQYAASYGVAGLSESSLTAYPIDGGSPTIWRQQTLGRGSDANNVLFFVPAGWWSKWGIAYSAGNFGGSAFDSSEWTGGYPISVTDRPGGRTSPLGPEVLNGANGPISVSSDGELAFTDNGFARPVWQAESVESCTPSTKRCAPVAEPTGTASMDPRWSPDGTELAYVLGPSSINTGWDEAYVEHWYDSLRLEVYGATTHRTAELTGGTGSVVPMWSSSGNELVLVRDDAIWLWAGTRRSPTKVAGPLLPPGFWGAYYGQLDWSAQFAWSSN